MWRHPIFGLWRTNLRDDLRERLARGERKVVAFADGHGAATAVFPVDGTDPFFNVNTPEDLAEAQARLAAGTA
jgi:molybdopterin-guanine dinucleotide biosynthesis protein A